MEIGIFLELLCNLYIVALLTALPLYTGEGYWQLGDTKYMLFRNISIFCLGCWMVLSVPGRLKKAAKHVRAFFPGKEKGGNFVRPRGGNGIATHSFGSFSALDCAVAAYGICVILSALISSYGRLAWHGYEGWYMGAFSQLLFVGIYFFVSRRYDGSAWPLYAGEAAFFAVTLLGLLHRLGVDPLGLMGDWDFHNWEYSHMMSTLGNINWLCGYYSVALSFVAAHYLQERKTWAVILLYVTCMSGFALLGVQGSQGGLMIPVVCAGVCLLWGRKRPKMRRRLWLMLTGAFLCMPLMELLMKLRGDKAAVVADGNIFGSVNRAVWFIGAGVCAVCFLLAGRFMGRSSERTAAKPGGGRDFEGSKAKRPKRIMIFSLGLLTAGLIFILMQQLLHNIDDGFGSGRGFLWRISAEAFEQADVKDKLFGAGPDCYAEAVFNRIGRGTDVWQGDHWEGAVFTNAHNEFLNQLCNLGILGTIAYGAIFLTGFLQFGSRCGKQGEFGALTGMLALAMYGVHSMVSFQQVLNTPLLFLVLGICGSRRGLSGERSS